MSPGSNNSAVALRGLLDKRTGHVHFVGVCGVGMAGVAFLLKKRGSKVSGCDSRLNKLADWLRKNGVKVMEGHSPAHIGGRVDWAIRTPAVPDDSPEIVKVRKAGLPLFSRGRVLPALLEGMTSVAVCGTHGKTTTTTFITQLLKSAGKDPSWCIGGENPELGGVAGAGEGARRHAARRACFAKATQAKDASPYQDAGQVEGRSLRLSRAPSQDDGYIVVEADESDGTLALYHPEIAVVTNIEFDHMEHFASVKAFEKCFKTFIRNTRRKVVFCADDPRAAALCKGEKKAVSYGLSGRAMVKGIDLKLAESSLSFTLVLAGKKVGSVELPVPGKHNALNALAVIAVGLELGLSFKEIRAGLKKVSLPRRRFEKVLERDGILVVSDYAHHPSEVRALVQTAMKLPHKRLLAVFQPHRYTRTLALGADFPAAFDGVDQLVLVPVYAASEKPIKGGMIEDLYREFRKKCSVFRVQGSGGRSRESEVRGQRSGETKNEERRTKNMLAHSLEQAWGYFKAQLRPGDVFLIVGAGDVEKIAGWVKERASKAQSGKGKAQRARRRERRGRNIRHSAFDIRHLVPALSLATIVRFDESLGRKTTMGVGGAADIWMEIGSVRDLVSALKWTRKNNLPFRVLGAGSNVVVSDLGVRGVTARLTGPEFKSMELAGDEIRIGAGVPIIKFLNWCEERGLGGYEFLEGIPGTMGGAVRMNAGAHGGEIGEFVKRVRCVAMDGKVFDISPVIRQGPPAAENPKLTFEYRRCPALEHCVAVEVVLKTGKLIPAGEIGQKRAAIAVKRAWWKGLRCAGSVFRNPAGGYAGRLIEKAGLKGISVGGARVSSLHANVIVSDQGALASDVLALIEMTRVEVLEKTGIRLEPEIITAG